MSESVYGIPADVIASICQVELSTARRWKRGESRIPYSAAALLLGDLGAFSKVWQGWRVQRDTLISPDGWQISRQDALTVPLMQAQLNAARAELEKYKATAHLEEQPAPPEAMPQIVASLAEV